ncbi:uncharacterized protein LOC143152025 isoform X2 [Ptiloglossa arizonensis]|uniref:uncharacterized protein LOC143152025 isoform X2 n=1 Tax=Ptiloglossa arizonensis TaxID=3350558 RepID=UPI003FA108EF
MQPVSCSRCTEWTWRTLLVRGKARNSIETNRERSISSSYRRNRYFQFDMRYKRIGIIGASLIASVCLLAGLMYYFNQVDLHGVLDWFGNDRDSLKEALRDFVCDVTDIPVGCTYMMCRATCHRYSEIPQNLSSQTTSISLYDSSIKRVPRNVFARYSEIRILYLDDIGISEIEIGAFANLTKLVSLYLFNYRIN